MRDWPARFSSYARRLIPSAIRGLAESGPAKDMISFGPGEPDGSLFPAAQIQASLTKLLSDNKRAQEVLQYAASAGHPVLRGRIARYMRDKGVPCGPENVLLTNGAQQALDLVAALLIEAGDTALVQAPSYPGALQVLVARGANVAAIDRADGPRGRASLIYAMSNFHNPTGRSLTLKERQDLLALARERDAVLIEDDPYEVLRYEGELAPPLLALDTEGRSIEEARTIYLGTFSKSVVPGLRVGWLVAPSIVVDKLILMKQTHDLQAGTLAQACLADIFDWVVSEHVDVLRKAYRRRRDAVLEALAAEFGNSAGWSAPQGGFFVWLNLGEGADTRAMLDEATRTGVAYVPGFAFHNDGRGSNFLRLSFSSAPIERIPEGVRRLAAVARAKR
jgi:DNA-binding transcriptional MocR family regulator